MAVKTESSEMIDAFAAGIRAKIGTPKVKDDGSVHATVTLAEARGIFETATGISTEVYKQVAAGKSAEIGGALTVATELGLDHVEKLRAAGEDGRNVVATVTIPMDDGTLRAKYQSHRTSLVPTTAATTANGTAGQEKVAIGRLSAKMDVESSIPKSVTETSAARTAVALGLKLED